MADRKTPGKTLLMVAVAVLLAAGGWFAWQYFNEPPPPPPPPPKAAKSAAAPAAPNQDKTIEEILRVTGMDHMLNQLPEQMLAGMRQAGKQDKSGKLSPGDLAELERLTREAFPAQGFRQRVTAALKKGFEAQRFREFLADSSMPLAKRMTELEKLQPKQEELAAFMAGLKAKPLAPMRVKLVERIDMAGRASELATESMFATVRGMARGFSGADAKQAADVDKAIEQQRAAAADNIRNAVRFSLAYAYRDVSDTDLAEYARLHEKPSTQFVLGLMFDALVEEIRSGSERLGAGLEKLLTAKRAGKPASAADAGSAAASRPMRSRAGEDARECLRFEANRQVMGCAERYR
ncbi:MAG: hypothetical protein ROZ00_01250 [Denitratisoma sp.]|nr:hypothetical protein [Denitratisoma sp.]